MNIILVTVLCAVAFGNPLDENKRLKRSNSVLLQALKELTQSETAVGDKKMCTSHRQCPGIDICSGGYCKTPTALETAVGDKKMCTSHRQCPGIDICSGGYCKTPTALETAVGDKKMCTSHRQCPGIDICSGGYCKTPTALESSVGYHDGYQYNSVNDGLYEYGGVEGCNCDGGNANSNGKGGSDCSASGNSNGNGKPWCYVGVDSTCTDLQGSSDNPWSEQACANPSRCTEWKNSMCDAGTRSDVYTADSFLYHGADTARTQDECYQWCAMKQIAGCCMWGKADAAPTSQDVCSFARGIMKKKAGGRRTHMNTINKHSICT